LTRRTQWSSHYFLYTTYTTTTWSVHYFPTLIIWHILWCKEAKLQAGIKPTALCSAIDKENSIESPLDFTTLYIQLLLWLCTLSPTVLMPVSWLLCHMLWPWLVTMCVWHDHSVTLVTPLWLCDCHVIFPMLHLSNNLKEKKRKKKRNINIDLAVLPSHNMWHHVMWPWHLWHDTFPHSFLCSKSKRKEKEK